jgi:hypothetical protein
VSAALVVICSVSITSCQKMDRPPLTELIVDPPPPPYNPLKSFWAFEDNAGDSGENKLGASATDVQFVEGKKGKGAKFGTAGYVLAPAVNDTIKNLGSFTVAFWMNGPGPVTGGAQGLFSISNKNEFWGNLDFFLENHDTGPADEAFLKIHMFNDKGAGGNGEEWTELKIPGVLGKWTHIALTYDELTSKLTLYKDGQPTSVNGKVLGGGNYGKVKYKDVNGIVIGNYQFQTNPTLTNHGPEAWAKPFAGTMDQVRLYNKALSATEVGALFTNNE